MGADIARVENVWFAFTTPSYIRSSCMGEKWRLPSLDKRGTVERIGMHAAPAQGVMFMENDRTYFSTATGFQIYMKRWLFNPIFQNFKYSHRHTLGYSDSSTSMSKMECTCSCTTKRACHSQHRNFKSYQTSYFTNVRYDLKRLSTTFLTQMNISQL